MRPVRAYQCASGEKIGVKKSLDQIIAAVAPNMSILIAGSTLLGLSAGLVLVIYAAVPEILPNKYRYVSASLALTTIH